MPATGGILALDVALKTGWAYGALTDNRPVSGTWVLPVACNRGGTVASIGNELSDAITLHQPKLVMLEAPLPRHSSAGAARLLLGLIAVCEATCHWCGVDCREQASSTVRKAVLGQGTFPKGEAKPAVMAWCVRQDWPFDNDNEADALLLWEFTRRIQQQRRRA